jgi:D-alanine-D-alanine ligase
MTPKAHVAVIFNEPVVVTESGHQFISQGSNFGAMSSHSEVVATLKPATVDLSEVGVMEEREHVEKALQHQGFRTSLFNIDGDIKRLVRFLEETKPDVVFNLCESLKGQAIHEMHVAGVYELVGVNYTGAATLALGTCLNKVRTKELLGYHGIPTAKHLLVRNADELNLDDLRLRFLLFVKPSREDASLGIENSSVVKDFSSLKERVAHVIKTYSQPALVEEYIEGRELNVAIMGNNPPEPLPISEIDFSKLPADYPKIVTYNAKWMEGTPEYVGTVGTCPAKLDPVIEQRVREIAVKAYRLMEIRDYARVDIRLSADGVPYVLEVNPNPDISRDAGFARSARTAGMTFEEMIAKIVEHALARAK